MTIPSITFGRCSRCGNRGGDDPSPSSADAAARDTVGNGMELKLYRGKYLCDICVIEVKDLEDSEPEMRKHEETQSFLSQAGFSKTIT